jgi:hypothetical protein
MALGQPMGHEMRRWDLLVHGIGVNQFNMEICLLQIDVFYRFYNGQLTIHEDVFPKRHLAKEIELTLTCSAADDITYHKKELNMGTLQPQNKLKTSGSTHKNPDISALLFNLQGKC